MDRGVRFEITAAPREYGNGWGLDLRVEATVKSPPGLRFFGKPAPQLSGSQHHADGSKTEFGDGCWSAQPVALPLGGSHVFERSYGQGLLEAVKPGGRVHLRIGFCRVRPEDAESLDPSIALNAAEAILSVSPDGVAHVELRRP